MVLKSGETLHFEKGLSTFLNELNDTSIKQIHQSYAVNPLYSCYFSKRENNTTNYYVNVDDSLQLLVSRTYLGLVKDAFSVCEP